MFETSLFESSGRLRPRPAWTTAASIALQTLALGLFVAIPLLHTEALPPLRLIVNPMPVPRGPAARNIAPAQPRGQSSGHALRDAIDLITPRDIPPTIAQVTDGPLGPPSVDELNGGGCQADCVPGAPPGFVPEIAHSALPAIPAPPQRIVVPPTVTAGQLIHRVQPIYPRIALLAGVEGTVVLQAIISKTGTIEDLHVVGGPPMLQQAAVDAVQQWRYRPFLLRNVPVEVETQITVNFVLSRNR